MTAAEAIKLSTEYCSGRKCNECAFYDGNNGRGVDCDLMHMNYPEEVVEILEDWKKERDIPAKTSKETKDASQEAKADAGKPQLTLVPFQIIYDIAAVREFGCKKYQDPDNWKKVSKERYRDAMFRHMLAYLKDPKGVDEESGLPHLYHMCTNAAFLCELEKQDDSSSNN